MKTLLPALLLTLAFSESLPAKTIPNHAIADLVLGKPDFTAGDSPSSTSSFRFSLPRAVVVDPVTRKVFVADTFYNRVLRYPSAGALANGTGAEMVFGQANFSDKTAAATRLGMNVPRGLFLDRLGRLWVADTSNNRILMFEAASYRTTPASPERVLGQPDFTTVSPGTANNKMSFAYGVWVDAADRLWVADTGNNRVLRFDAVTNGSSTNSAADAVLGQPDFNTSTVRTGAAGFFNPTAVAVSPGGALFVALSIQNRILRFNGAGTLPSGLNNAGAVLGQLDFTGTAPGVSGTQMQSPSGITITPDDTLWVSDTDNHRLIRFDKASTRTSGSAADGVVGQPNLTTRTPATTNRSLIEPEYSPCVDATGSLWVPDSYNNRVLRFPPDVTKPLLAVTSVVPKTTPKKKVLIKGTASDLYGVSKVQYKIGKGSLRTATGTKSWQFTANLATGKNTITVFATDSVGNVSSSRVVKIKRE